MDTVQAGSSLDKVLRMAEKDHSVEKLTGVPLNQFKSAIEALGELREAGKFLLFVSRFGAVKYLLRNDEFKNAFCRHHSLESDDAGIAERALEETRKFAQARLANDSDDDGIRQLTSDPVKSALDDAAPEERDKVLQLMKSKIELVSSRLLTRSLTQRVARLETVTGACLEDVDVEVVSERHDRPTGVTVSGPFLRLRIRYFDSPHGAFDAIFAKAAPKLGSLLDSFEFDCDEMDIDLLINRLRGAKELLLAAANRDVTEMEKGN